MNDHKAARAVIREINKIITWMEVLVLAGLLLFGIYAILDNRRIDTENTSDQYEMYRPSAEDTRTYDDFRNVNPDVCGWLTIDNTGIDYPLVQGDDNDEYMNKTPDLQFALSGSLFLDYQNRKDFADFNTIIYGHHMEGPSMFGELDRFAEKSFFDSHESAELYCGGKWHSVDLFAFLEADAYDRSIYHIASGREEAGKYLDSIRQKADRYREIGVTSSDRIVVLSTCMTDLTNGRYLVIGRIGDVTDSPAEAETDTAAGAADKEGNSSAKRKKVSLLISAAAAVFVILLLACAAGRKKQKRQMRAAARKKETSEASVSGSVPDTGSSDMKREGGRGKKKRTVRRDLLDLLIRIAVVIAVIWTIFHFIFGVFVNSGVSMEPTVQDRDIVLFYRLNRDYRTNEAVVYRGGGEERVGRIAAKGGDTVEITEDGLMVNGYLQQDVKSTGETLAASGGTRYPVTLAEGEYFILGDNREESTDSRMFGPVSQSDIEGSASIVIRRRDV